jgi:Xaa-Pro aminopeptidase
LGLDCHDPGGLRALPGNDKEIGRGNSNNDFAIEENFIVTVEPGIYDNNFGGCRFEDDVLVTSGGTEVLTKSRLLRFHPSDFNI